MFSLHKLRVFNTKLFELTFRNSKSLKFKILKIKVNLHKNVVPLNSIFFIEINGFLVFEYYVCEVPIIYLNYTI